MPRVTPDTRMGGEENFEKRIVAVMGGLGHFLGIMILVFTVILIAFDVVMNPIFLFAQAKSSGIEISSPFGHGLFGFLGFFSVIVITVCTTGLQYALLQPGKKKWGVGHLAGFIIAILDTTMDGGGFLAWKAGGHMLQFSGDSSHLRWGMFPPVGADSGQWITWGAVCLMCFFHEPFLKKTLGVMRGKEEPGPESGVLNINMHKWVVRAGKLLHQVSLVVLSLTPYFMFLLDVLLFPQTMRGEDSVTFTVWVVFTFVMAAGSIALWRYWNHIRVEGGYKLSQLDWPHRLMFLGAVAASTIDSAFDLKGLNEVVYHQGGFVPQNLPPGGFQQWLLTGAIVMIICTAFAPMCSQLFGPLSALASRLPGYDVGGAGGFSFDEGFDRAGDFGGVGGDPFGPAGGADPFGFGGDGSGAGAEKDFGGGPPPGGSKFDV